MNRWGRRLLVGLLILLALVVLVPLGLFAFDATFGPRTADVANTTFVDGRGETLLGYLAQPEGAGPHPGVLLLHEWWGLNEGITILADALAQEGYVVFAPDAYRGRVASQIPRALYLRLTTPEAQVKGDLDAVSYTHLRIAERHTLALPRPFDPATDTITAGLYDPTSGRRLPLTDDGAPPGDAFVLPPGE